MQPEHLRLGGGVTGTTLHPAVAAVMLLTIVLMFVLPRRYMLIPFLFDGLLTPLGQGLYIDGAHIYVLRILVLFAWIRLLGSRMTSQTSLLQGRWNAVDTAFTCWVFFRTSAFLLTFQSLAAVINQVSFLWWSLGGYFLLRILIQDDDDIKRAIKALAVIAAIVAAGMLNEKITDRNVFGYLGNPPSIMTGLRDGAIRAQGPFSHAILAGCFGATILPLFFWLWKSGKSKLLAFVAMISSTVIMAATASSTPALAYMAAIVGICFWPLRKQMRPIRWGIAIGLITLHLIMKAPVWFLIAHIDLIGASSGYHRAFLIDQFVRNFRDWWLIGTVDNGTWGWDMWDTSNGFVAEGVAGGLLTLICFVAIICLSFGRLGDARKSVNGQRREEWLVWLLGGALFAHIVAFFGISYFDQTEMAWYLLLAMISAATAVRLKKPVKSAALRLAGFNSVTGRRLAFVERTGNEGFKSNR